VFGRAQFVEQRRRHATALARIRRIARHARVQGRQAGTHAGDLIARRCVRGSRRRRPVDRPQHRVEQHAAARTLHRHERLGQAGAVCARQEVERQILVHPQARCRERRAQAVGRQ